MHVIPKRRKSYDARLCNTPEVYHLNDTCRGSLKKNLSPYLCLSVLGPKLWIQTDLYTNLTFM